MKLNEKVLRLVKTIPPGKITTYSFIGKKLKSKAYRAIGNILGKNELGFLNKGNIPCHRVVRFNGILGGFSGGTDEKMVLKKKNLLKKEGIKFKQDKIVDFEKKLYQF